MECLGNSNKCFSTFRHLTEKLDHTLFDFCKQTANSKQKNHFGYTLKLQLSVSRTKENIYLTSHLHTQSCLDQALNKLNSFKIKNEISDEIQGWHGHHPPLGRLPTDRQAEK